MSTRAAAGGLLAAAFLVSLVFTPATSLTVRSEAGSIDLCRTVHGGTPVNLVFTNSMFGGEVRETYKVDGDALRRIAFVTEVAAAAEYYAWTAPIVKTEEGYEVVVPQVSVGAIPVLVDEIGAYRLEVDGEAIDLSGMVDTPESVVIEVESGSVVTRWWRGC